MRLQLCAPRRPQFLSCREIGRGGMGGGGRGGGFGGFSNSMPWHCRCVCLFLFCFFEKKKNLAGNKFDMRVRIYLYIFLHRRGHICCGVPGMVRGRRIAHPRSGAVVPFLTSPPGFPRVAKKHGVTRSSYLFCVACAD